jgi:NAD(P)-dependent dehydrogenase (short-subunit alcohol dehydrogenase family)
MTTNTSTGRVAVVTGGGRGIGAATVKALAARGWDVCIGYRSDAAAAGEVAAACKALGREAVAVEADVASEDGVAGLFLAADRLGTVGALVNNAGIVDKRARVDQLDLARLRRMFAINTLGAFLCAKEAVLRMSTRHGGSGGVIVNVSSSAARIGGAGEYVDYAAAKGAVDSLTIGLAREVAEEGIRVVGVRPGFIHTSIHASGGQPNRLELVKDAIPMRRGGQPEEVAVAIAWLCSDEASYVTGTILDVSGGR